MSHPIHPAIVHFPIACWSLATLSDSALFLFAIDTTQFGAWLHLVGVATGLLAMLAGFFELGKIQNTDTEALRFANLHMGAASATWCIYAAAVFLRLDDGMQLSPVTTVTWALSVLGFLSLAVTGWLGATLVYRYKVGTAPE